LTGILQRCTIRGRRLAGLALGLMLGAGGAIADQTHPDLDLLFDRIAVEEDPRAARELELRIWDLWMQPPDPASGVLLVEGVRAMDRRHFDAAGRMLDIVVSEYPRFAEGWNRRATLHYLRGDLEASLGDIEETLNLEPRHFGAWSGLGLVLMRLDDRVGAIAAFETALGLHPTMMGPRMNLRRLRGERSSDPMQ